MNQILKDQYMVTLFSSSFVIFSGFLVGCSIALFVAVVLLVQTRKLLNKENAKIYMDNIFPLYR